MRVKSNQIFSLLVFSVMVMSDVFAQNLPDSIAKQIDKIFEKSNASNSAGCAVGIIRNDTLIYAKGYGLANLEHAIPITSETLFNTGSISKQITGYCILLLARQGKLKLDEDIHTYLAWMPDFGKKIKVRNLLNHTSGLRDYVGLAGIAGLDMDGMLTQDYALKLIRKQRGLSFNPGENFAYSNSNYGLLAEIVKGVSGQSFRAFTDSAIFKPLGMGNSFIPEDQKVLIKNRAASYSKVGSPYYSNYFQNLYLSGDGGLFSNAKDMAKWMMNFFQPKVGEQEDIEQLTKKGKLNSGKELSYAAGIAVNSYKGQKEYVHGGANAGYTSSLSVFPDLKLGVVVLSNIVLVFPAARVHELADIFIKSTASDVGTAFSIDTSSAILKDVDRMKKYAGDYMSDEGEQLRFGIRNQKLYWERYGRTDLLLPVGNDSFLVAENPAMKFVFRTLGKTDTTVKQYTSNEEHISIKFKTIETPQTKRQFQGFTGSYYSPELDCVYNIVFNGKDLLLRQGKIEDSKITLIGKDDLLADFWWMRHLKIIRNKTNDIVGFDVDVEGVMHLRFNKIESIK